MSTQAHTPGPWHAEIGRTRDGDPAFGFGVFPDKPTLGNLPESIRQHSLASGNFYEHSAFSAFYPPEVIEANARLIAAAPDMLAALKFVHEHIADKERGPRDLYPAFGLNSTRAIEMVNAAIAKAEGRS